MPRPPGSPAPMPGLPGVEQRRHAELLRAPRRAGSTRRSFGSKACRLGWNLKPAHAVSLDEPPGPAHRGAAARAGRPSRTGSARRGARRPGRRSPRSTAAGARWRAGASTVNTTAAMLPLAVVLGDRVRGRRAVLVGRKYCGRGVQQLLVEGEAAVAVLLDVGVHVDRGRGRRGRSVTGAPQQGGGRPWRPAARSARRRAGRPASAGSTPASSSSTPATRRSVELRGQRDRAEVVPPRLGRRAEVLQDVGQPARARRRGAG